VHKLKQNSTIALRTLRKPHKKARIISEKKIIKRDVITKTENS